MSAPTKPAAPKAASTPAKPAPASVSIAETREVIRLTRSIWAEIGNLLDKDGKIGILDALGLMVRLKDELAAAREGIEMVPFELADLDRAELVQQLGPEILELVADILEAFKRRP